MTGLKSNLEPPFYGPNKLAFLTLYTQSINLQKNINLGGGQFFSNKYQNALIRAQQFKNIKIGGH